MNTVLTSLVAVFATLAGSTLTFAFQRHTALQTERFTRNRQFWTERVSTYSAFAAAMTDFRRSQNDRWHLEQRDPNSSKVASARQESYQRRADATAALYRVRLVSHDPSLDLLAQAALDVTTDIHTAHDEEDRTKRGEKARIALDRFLSDALPQVH